MNGLFYIGIDYETFRDTVNEELIEAVDPVSKKVIDQEAKDAIPEVPESWSTADGSKSITVNQETQKLEFAN